MPVDASPGGGNIYTISPPSQKLSKRLSLNAEKNNAELQGQTHYAKRRRTNKITWGQHHTVAYVRLSAYVQNLAVRGGWDRPPICETDSLQQLVPEATTRRLLPSTNNKKGTPAPCGLAEECGNCNATRCSNHLHRRSPFAVDYARPGSSASERIPKMEFDRTKTRLVLISRYSQFRFSGRNESH